MAQTLNAAVVAPVARQPRILALVNGQPTTPLSIHHDSHNWYSSDTFSVSFAVNADPAFPATFWQDQQDIRLDLRASLDGGASYTSLIVGDVDTTDWSPETGVVTCEGRDLSALLIEAPTAEKFANQTTSAIATLLAGRHGLTPVVKATTTPVSRYFQIDYDHTTLGNGHYTTTEWDLLTFLAKCEGFDLFVSGTSLYFQPPATGTPWVASVAMSPFTANVMDLRCQHHKTLARALTVEVRSFSAKTGTAVLAKATGGGTGPRWPQDDATRLQVFRYVFPNLSQDMAQKRANALLEELKKHERSISFSVPGDITLTARSTLALTGTGTVADQSYFADTITRDMDFDNGFRMTVSAKNRDQRGLVNA